MKQVTKEIYDPIETWLASFRSRQTRELYRSSFKKFSEFAQVKADDIVEEFDQILKSENAYGLAELFKRKYARRLRAWTVALQQQGYAQNTQRSKESAVKSFFRHNELPLGRVNLPEAEVEYTNRDIDREEIALIVSASKPRERAFYLVMAQSGIRPDTLCKLQLKDIEFDRLQKLKVPVKLDVPKNKAKGHYHGYWTFIGFDAAVALKAYLATRTALDKDSLLFARKREEEKGKLNPQVPSALFRRLVRQLRKADKLDYEVTRGKPSELRLYNLRKFFRKYAYQAGHDYVEWWFGHSLGVNKHYKAQDVEHHRGLYKEKALPFLRIEDGTPIETERVIKELEQQLAQRDETIRSMRWRMAELSKAVRKMQKQRKPV